MIGDPLLTVGDDAVIVLPWARHCSEGQLPVTSVAEQEDFGDPARFRLAAEPRHEIERKLRPGG